ncbi:MULTISPECIES: hypothetical protein [Burkholderia]|uniref:Uncharacterized protein n=2 Tax=Burkholderia humptydooensis TaxID=430531 RepID=A0A7U4SVY4_9BURK|nr:MULTISPECIES: hypothetical protein [Burkholderia]AJY39602.1 hypothetical protein BW21_4776 [Burkholderia sp. 2002721687]ALX46433.1 hypothetical protein AQ610_29230 [Burkholderia humptydooensis]EIP85865.1 hypothetical protein A33K_16955 [Burkholderia humptydooensis MSMB43]KVN17949.1 hypothetical protein WT08_02135 [Burkholderia sp. MSMB1552]KWZ55501.1 hypothetical protein WS92_05945 [Burkholderia sp. MSMB1588]
MSARKQTQGTFDGDERVLIEDAQADRDEFDADYRDRGCSCFISPPCSFCTHPGNPRNQDEDESCWKEA